MSTDEDVARFESVIRPWLNPDLVAGLPQLEQFLMGNDSLCFAHLRSTLNHGMRPGACRCCWTSVSIAAECITCGRGTSAIFCLECLRNGNHEGHHIHLLDVPHGTCHCGNPKAMDPSGFCRHHFAPVLNPDLSLDPAFRLKLIAASSVIWNALAFYAVHDQPGFFIGLNWLFEFVSISEDTRRCAVLGFLRSVDGSSFVVNCHSLNEPDSHRFYHLFGGLLSDQVFTAHISKSFLSQMPRFLDWHLAFAHREDINLANSAVAICFLGNLLTDAVAPFHGTQ